MAIKSNILKDTSTRASIASSFFGPWFSFKINYESACKTFFNASDVYDCQLEQLSEGTWNATFTYNHMDDVETGTDLLTAKALCYKLQATKRLEAMISKALKNILK